jgi:hypothetical protein
MSVGILKLQPLIVKANPSSWKMGSPGLAPAFLGWLGFKLEEFGSSGSAGKYLSNTLRAYIPQREACEQIGPEGGPGKTASPFEFP